VYQSCKISCLDFGARHENFVSIYHRLQNGIHVMHPLYRQAGGNRRVPDLSCERDEEEQSIPFLQLPHVCGSWCEVGHCREGEGRHSCLRLDELYRCVFAARLKFPCTTCDVLRSRDREFNSTGTQRLSQLCYKCVENEGKRLC
jgi:hypothetical protein